MRLFNVLWMYPILAIQRLVDKLFLICDHLWVGGSIIVLALQCIFESKLDFWSNKFQQPCSGVHKQQIVLSWHSLSFFDNFCSSFAVVDTSSQPFHQMPELGFNLISLSSLIVQHKTFYLSFHQGPLAPAQVFWLNLLCFRKAPMVHHGGKHPKQKKRQSPTESVSTITACETSWYQFQTPRCHAP